MCVRGNLGTAERRRRLGHETCSGSSELQAQRPGVYVCAAGAEVEGAGERAEGRGWDEERKTCIFQRCWL